MKINKIVSILFLFSGTALANTSSLILMSNQDGTQWTQQISSLYPLAHSIDRLTLISQYNKNFITIGNNGDEDSYGFYSIDGGNNWNSSTFQHMPHLITGLTVNNQGWVATGADFSGNGQLAITGDIDNWRLTPVDYSQCSQIKKINGVQSNDSTFLAFISCEGSYPYTIRPAILMSTNGLDWNRTAITLPTEMQDEKATFNNAYWEGKEWILLATKADNTPLMYTTSDLQNLTSITLPAEINSLQSIATYGDQWLATGTYKNNGNKAAAILISNNKGSSWTLQKSFPVTISQLNKITRNENTWMAVGSAIQSNKVYPVVLSSKDGNTWQQATLPVKVVGPSDNATLDDIAWDGQKWIAVGSYDENATGCRALNNIKDWAGILSGTDNHLKVKDLSVWVPSSSHEKNGAYDVNGWIEYDDDHTSGGAFMFGTFSGTCNEHDDGSIDFGMNFESYSINGVKKSPADAQLAITSSSLEDSSGFNHNYTGTLAPKDSGRGNYSKHKN